VSNLTVSPEKSSRAARPSIVQSFHIEGLYGYRSVALDSEYAATVIIAKNGSGKTTLLATLYAFLRGQFAKLKDLEFSRIHCRLSGVEGELVVYKEDIQHLHEVVDASELPKYARRFEVPALELFNFLERDLSDGVSDYYELSDNKIFNAILRHSNYSRKEAFELCTRISGSYYEHVPRLRSTWEVVRARFADVEILYLPTYRRIELPLVDPERDRPAYRRPRTNMRFAETGLFPANVQFGLGDVTERLSQLNQRLLTDSNISYREISANIINELIDGTFERLDDTDKDIPDIDELSLFFARLKGGGGARGLGPRYADVAIPNIERIYSGEGISLQSNRFLNYFLSKLTSAIRATRDIEVMVETFINVCNKYLSRFDPSTIAPPYEAYERELADGKVLRLNRLNLTVHVESVALGRKIKLNSLSSGEKQMISLFGNLYLYEKEKVILIDEPELSLSIDWQRQLLVDFINAPTCVQLIAITHSPFVFDNELEPFARSMRTSVDLSSLPTEVSEEDGDAT
jgi:predicted ATPase